MGLFSKQVTNQLVITRPNVQEKRQDDLDSVKYRTGAIVARFEDLIETLDQIAREAEMVAVGASEDIDVLLQQEAEALAEADRARRVANNVRALVV